MGLAASRLLSGEPAGSPSMVHSVFRRVFNILAPSGRLLSFATSDVPAAPATVVTELDPESGWLALGIQTEDRVCMDQGALCLPRRNVRIALAGADVFVPRIQGVVEVAPDRVEPMLHRAAELGYQASAGRSGSSGFRDLVPHVHAVFEPSPGAMHFADPFCRAGLAHMADLVGGVRTKDPQRIRKAARGLLGLGPGLTPSGDDALCGWMVALALATRAFGVERVALEQVNPLILAEVPGATGQLSAEFLRYAASGQANALVEEVIAGILAGDEQQLPATIARLCETGASSGTDQLWGILVGVRLGLESAAR